MLDQCNNLVQLLLQNLNIRPAKQAFFSKKQGIYAPITYQECFENVKWFALGLSNLGIGEEDFVAILSGNRPEWVFSDFGIMSVGAVSVPIYTTLSPPEIAHILNDSKAKAVIVETAEQLDRVLKILPECPTVQHLVTIDRHIKIDLAIWKSFDEVQLIGKQSASKAYEEYLAHLEKIQPEHLASVVYTSGTTGQPKGVMLTHGNFLANVRDIMLSLPLSDSDTVLSFLPLSHVFERTTGYYTLIFYTARPDDRTWKGKFQFWWADRLVLSKIRERTGGRIRFFVSGGAPLSKEIAEFFHDLGLLVIEGYGLTETSPVIACNRLEKYKFGTVGKALPSVEVRLGDDGELQARGPSVMKGYLNLPAQSAEAVDDDGWFHTGDIAEIDRDGFISIVDRKKEIIVLSNGKKVAPQMVEARLKSSPYISQVMVIGDQYSYLTALIVPDFKRVKAALERQGNHMLSVDTLVRHPEVVRFFDNIVQTQMRDLAGFEQVKRFTLLDREFTSEEGELTPSLKMRRKVIEKKFAKYIESMYASPFVG
ncbi:long-chain fatty acid--CoA ligase [bacterium]|nr:long-chain fatty acid--CoA ligase [bacterium]